MEYLPAGLEAPFLVKQDEYHLEKITPYKVVLFELAEYLGGREMDNRWKASVAILFHQLIPIEDLDIEEVVERFESLFPGDSDLIDGFLSRLKEVAQSADALHLNLDAILVDPPRPMVTSKSLLGLFLRRLKLSVARMRLGEHLAFQDKWEAYLSPLLNPGAETSFAGRGREDAGLFSRRQALAFITAQTQVLLEHSGRDAESAQKIRKAVDLITHRFPDMYQVYFLSFANRLRERDVFGAREALQCYLDTVSLSFLYQQRASDEPQAAHLSKAFRYGPLLLAKLYRSFGYKEEASRMLRECVNHTQISGDQCALQHLLLERIHQESDDLETLLPLHNALRKSAAALGRSDHVLRSRYLACGQLLASRHSPKSVLASINSPEFRADCQPRGECAARTRGLADLKVAFRGLASSLHLGSGDWELGLEYAEMAGESPAAIANAAFVLAARGHAPHAMRLLEEAEKTPETLLASSLLTYDTAYFGGHWERVESTLRDLALLNPTEHTLRLSLYEEAWGNQSEARALLRRLLKDLPSGPSRWYDRGRVLLTLAELLLSTRPPLAADLLTEATALAKEQGFEAQLVLGSLLQCRLDLINGLDGELGDVRPFDLPTRLKTCLIKARLAVTNDSKSRNFVREMEEGKGIALELGSYGVAGDISFALAYYWDGCGEEVERNAAAQRATEYFDVSPREDARWINVVHWLTA